MAVKTTVPSAIWDAKKFHWKLFVQGKFECLKGCPNWLYEAIRQIKESGQPQEGTVYILVGSKFQYAVRFAEDTVQVYQKKK